MVETCYKYLDWVFLTSFYQFVLEISKIIAVWNLCPLILVFLILQILGESILDHFQSKEGWLAERCTRCVNSLIDTASCRWRNYILDQVSTPKFWIHFRFLLGNINLMGIGAGKRAVSDATRKSQSFWGIQTLGCRDLTVGKRLRRIR